MNREVHVRFWERAEVQFLRATRQNPNPPFLGLMSDWPTRPGEFHPEPLTDPDFNLSIHPARATARRLPPSIDYRVPPVAG